jgi:hypothetical protein
MKGIITEVESAGHNGLLPLEAKLLLFVGYVRYQERPLHQLSFPLFRRWNLMESAHIGARILERKTIIRYAICHLDLLQLPLMIAPDNGP